MFIDIWSTGCNPCVGEVPYIKDMEHRFAGKPITWVSISMDLNKKEWLDFLKEKGMNGIQLICNKGYKDPFPKQIALRGIPRFLLLDKEGKVIGVMTVDDITKEGETEVISKRIEVVWVPSTDNIENKQAFHQALYNGSSVYKQAIKGVLKKLNLLPPSAAMAGIYTMVDNSRGVWKAPANVTLSYVDSLVEDIDDDQQADLNAPAHGKAVNVIRLFRGEGIKVWGARTLDGNSLDWRYVNVRRTLLFLEESIKNAARAYVFEPNVAGTWINMKCMIENFLRSVWKRGGLAGATPEDAFEVHIGLGDTMTAEDILDGIMRITVLVAVTHPAEFIEITFQQQAQKS